MKNKLSSELLKIAREIVADGRGDTSLNDWFGELYEDEKGSMVESGPRHFKHLTNRNSLGETLVQEEGKPLGHDLNFPEAYYNELHRKGKGKELSHLETTDAKKISDGTAHVITEESEEYKSIADKLSFNLNRLYDVLQAITESSLFVYDKIGSERDALRATIEAKQKELELSSVGDSLSKYREFVRQYNKMVYELEGVLRETEIQNSESKKLAIRVGRLIVRATYKPATSRPGSSQLIDAENPGGWNDERQNNTLERTDNPGFLDPVRGALSKANLMKDLKTREARTEKANEIIIDALKKAQDTASLVKNEIQGFSFYMKRVNDEIVRIDADVPGNLGAAPDRVDLYHGKNLKDPSKKKRSSVVVSTVLGEWVKKLWDYLKKAYNWVVEGVKKVFHAVTAQSNTIEDIASVVDTLEAAFDEMGM